jgi:hypothetical protein
LLATPRVVEGRPELAVSQTGKVQGQLRRPRFALRGEALRSRAASGHELRGRLCSAKNDAHRGSRLKELVTTPRENRIVTGWKAV